ncbi:hypothetical protein JTB14_023673 [Gonioctena quinquepunctata]|nr:hypothetical protein JTB14_023673 [Gonioctena quinquepunctata]
MPPKLNNKTAATQYNINRRTLRNKLKGRSPESSGRVGPESILGRHIEDKLEEWLLGTSSMGFPINRDFLIHSVKQLVEAEGMNNPFKDNVPGRKWFEGFLERRLRVGQKKAEHLCKARAVVTESGIRSWFSHVAEELGGNIEILKDPRRVFYMDETAIHLAPKGGLVLAERGKSVYDVAVEELLQSFISHSPNQNPDFGVPLSPEPSIPSDINTDSNTIRAVLPSSNNAIQSSSVIIEVIEPDAVSTLSTENVSNSNTMTMRRKALDEVINQIVMWPKKQPSKRKRAVEHLPSVITSEKWIEVMEAKENERNEKEEEKKLKKIEREERIEKNKQIKQEKLEEQANNKSAKELAAKKSVKSRKKSNK